MKTSATRILTTHVGSMPRPESIKALLRDRLAGRTAEEGRLSALVGNAVADAVRQQARVGIDIVSDGEMSKTSFLAPSSPVKSTSSRLGRCTTTFVVWKMWSGSSFSSE